MWLFSVSFIICCFFVHLSFVFCFFYLFVHVGVRELTLLFSHLQRQRNTKKVLHNSYHTLLSGLRPYSSPYLSGDRYAPRHLSQLCSTFRQVAKCQPTVIHSTVATEICRTTHSGVHNRCFQNFLHGHLVCLTVFH